MARKLLLQFSAAEQLFAIESKQIVEIIPLVDLTKVPSTAEYISGLYNYRGELIPVIDICRLLFKQPAREHICTRIIVTEATFNNSLYRTGIIAEKVNQTLACDTADISLHNLTDKNTSYIRQVIKQGEDNIQIIDLESLLPSEMLQLQQAVNS